MADTAEATFFIWDNVLPLAPEVGNDFGILARFHAAGHAMVSLTIAGDDCDLSAAMHRLARVHADLAKASDRFLLATTLEDIQRARREGKLAVGLHLEGTECLERDPDMIDVMHALGIRHAILAFNQNNSAAGGCMEVDEVGLSRLGRRYLERMVKVGMLLDLSHTSRKATLEAIDLIGRPVLFTHSNADALYRHPRNLTDEQARACAAVGGVIGISGSSMYLGRDLPLATSMFRHIDYFVQLVGPDHVALGTDYIVDGDATRALLASRPDEWPMEDLDAPLFFMPPEELVDVIGAMELAGYAAAQIAQILGGNYIRVAGQVWE